MHSCSPAAILVAAVKKSSPAVPSDAVMNSSMSWLARHTPHKKQQNLQIVEGKEEPYYYCH